MVLCGDGESFAAQEVTRMLALSAQMTPIPKGASFAFAFGKIAGSMNAKPEDIVILSSDEGITTAAEAFGYGTSAGKAKPRSAKPKARGRKPAEIMPPPETPVTEQIPTYKSVVFNRFHNQYFHESHYWIGEWNRLYTHVTNKKEIRFCVKRPANRYAFSAAIAWLTSGNDIADYGKIPQDFDLYAYASSSGNPDDIPNIYNYIGHSLDADNAFEKMSFWTSAEYITFRIVLFTEDNRSENFGQVVLGFDVSATD